MKQLSPSLFFYDRDNPDMSVGTLYPLMSQFRLAVKQHAIYSMSLSWALRNLILKGLENFANQKDASGLLELELREITVLGYILLTIFCSRTCHYFLI